MRDELCLRYIGGYLGDSRLCGVNREVLGRFDGELVTARFRATTRRGYAYALNRLGVFLGDKGFKDVGREDLQGFFTALNGDGLNEHSIVIIQSRIKRFFKWLYTGSLFGRDYPSVVNWFVPCMRDGLPLNPEDVLTPQDIQVLVDACYTPRDKALTLTLWESGGRAEEVLALNIGSLVFQDWGCTAILKGKTGERVVQLIHSAPTLQHLVNHHPLRRFGRGQPLFINYKTRKRLTYAGLYSFTLELKRRVEIDKPLNPHSFRHARATFLADKITEYQMCLFFGWKIGSKAPRRYVHLAGRDLKPAILAVSGAGEFKEPVKDLTLKPVTCPRCGKQNPAEGQYCYVCGQILDLKLAVETTQKDMFLQQFSQILENPEAQEKFLKFLKELAQE